MYTSKYLHLWIILLHCVHLLRADETSPLHWYQLGQKDLVDALKLQPNTNIAKNVIIFVGDGVGMSTITSTRMYKGQQQGGLGEDYSLVFDKFPYVGLTKTYNVDHQVTDSGAAAVAIFTGVKTNRAILGVSAKSKLGNCESVAGNEISSVLTWAQEAGKSTGFVTTTRVTHSTPAALYSHTADKDWEADFMMPPDVTGGCKDISRQMMEDKPGRDTKVILGGGRNNFRPSTYRDPGTNSIGNRLDGRDLIEYWLKDKKDRNARAKYVTNAAQLSQITKGSVDYLLGLFTPEHMNFDTDRDKGPKGEPSLSEMTRAAINVLQQDDNGFFLMVEGGKIDHAHHYNNAKRAIVDTARMAEAVETALEMVSTENTLIIVTGDHSHGFVINGYADRGTSIFGLAGKSNIDHLPYTTLMYAVGPGYNETKDGKRRNLTNVDTESVGYIQDTFIPFNRAVHGGEDVPVYAVGPMAHLFHGVTENTYIAHVMAYASCIGTNKDHCKKQVQPQFPEQKQPKHLSNQGNCVRAISLTLMVISCIIFAKCRYIL